MQIPESRLIRGEVMLRDLQLTSDVKLTKKSLIRWLALASGMISANESRTTIFDLLDALLHFGFSEKDADIADIMGYMEKNSGKKEKPNEKTVRYHLLQLKKKGLIEHEAGIYRFVIPPLGQGGDIPASFEHAFRSRSDIAFAKIRDALGSLKDKYK